MVTREFMVASALPDGNEIFHHLKAENRVKRKYKNENKKQEK